MGKKKGKPRNKRDALWAEAKRRCRLNEEDIRMAKKMGLNPKSLIKNIPSKSQQWKAPVKYWIREMYEKRQKRAARKKGHKEQTAVPYAGIDKKQQPEESTSIFDRPHSDNSIPGNNARKTLEDTTTGDLLGEIEWDDKDLPF